MDILRLIYGNHNIWQSIAFDEKSFDAVFFNFFNAKDVIII